MIFSRDRNTLRKMYVDAWQKSRSKKPLSALEAQIVELIELHPEYHDDMSSSQLARDYTPAEGQTNPFLHLGLHLGLREQIATDRPPGIKAVFNKILHKTADRHATEHAMIECLAETLWEAQSRNRPPDEQAYLERLRRIAG